MKFKIIDKMNYCNVLILIGFILGILWISSINTIPFSDFDYYNNLATEIAHGGSVGDTYTSVGYAIILGYIYKLFGAKIIIAKIFNLLLSLGSNILLLKLMNKLKFSRPKKNSLLTLFVLFPSNIFYVSILGTEVLFTFILILATYIYFSEKKYRYIILGILTGINSMIKPFFILLFFAIFIIELLKERKFISPLKNSAIILVVTMLTIYPLIYRNTKLVGRFTFISNNGGIVLYINNNSQNTAGRWMPASSVENSIVNTKEYNDSNMTVKNQMLSKAAKKWIIGHPVQFVKLGFKRLFNTYLSCDDGYSLYGTGIKEITKNNIKVQTWIINNTISIPGILIILVKSIEILIEIIKGNSKNLNKYELYLIIVFYMFTAVYFVTEGQVRYSFPVAFIITYFFYIFIEKIYLLKNKDKLIV